MRLALGVGAPTAALSAISTTRLRPPRGISKYLAMVTDGLSYQPRSCVGFEIEDTDLATDIVLCGVSMKEAP
jgi:hypothetical protein